MGLRFDFIFVGVIHRRRDQTVCDENFLITERKMALKKAYSFSGLRGGQALPLRFRANGPQPRSQ